MTTAAIIEAILAGGPAVLDFFIKIESLLNLGPSDKANIASAIASANNVNSDTLARISAWMQANGFQAQVTFVPSKPITPVA